MTGCADAAAVESRLEACCRSYSINSNTPLDMDNRDELDAEHQALREQVDELQREHDQLRARPHDMAGHEEHRRKLEAKIAELRAHMARLKDMT
jgi:DNA repair exonuclease SbcCD ATPase subunit